MCWRSFSSATDPCAPGRQRSELRRCRQRPRVHRAPGWVKEVLIPLETCAESLQAGACEQTVTGKHSVRGARGSERRGHGEAAFHDPQMQEKCCRLQAGTEPPATADRSIAAKGFEKPIICYFSYLGRVWEGGGGGDDVPCSAGEQVALGALSASGARSLAEKSPVTWLRAIPAPEQSLTAACHRTAPEQVPCLWFVGTELFL